jgi:hypothetical protein
MTVEVQAAASALVGSETVITSHEKDDDESDEESDCENSYGGDDSEDNPENDNYESNETELFD